MITKKIKNGKFNIMKILHSKAVIGVILGIIGIMVYFIALFLPWYVVTGDIQTTMVETTGKTDWFSLMASTDLGLTHYKAIKD
jgi:hypothetical protein